jgi:uncharacterized Zn-binding protein involved in type VI secretion
MSGQPAARLTDNIACAVPQSTPAALPHAPPPGSPIVGVGAPNVIIGGMPAARVGDHSICLSPMPLPNPIMRGAFPVSIAGLPAARLTDQATHPGSIIAGPCCPTVLIGLAGTTGNPAAGEQTCLNMAQGRNPTPGSTDLNGNPLQPNTPGQSYNNCGIESSRQLINRKGGNMSQEGLYLLAAFLKLADFPLIGTMTGGRLVTAQNQAFFGGGTNVFGIQAMLAQFGIDSTVSSSVSLSGFELALSQGRAWIATGDVVGLPGWGTATGGHAVLVTGFVYDDAGELTDVIYNDTGIGVCRQQATAAQFRVFLGALALRAIVNGQLVRGGVVSNQPVW